eukprot:Hpha_TRINITY_DN8639_c0_g1::TRINITY_DN8639_c0_g1_i1::g.168623::m.168623
MRSLGLLSCALFASCAPIPHVEKFPPHRHAAIHRVLGEGYAKEPIVAASHSFNPADFGGDPSGEKDSTDAVRAAIAAMLLASNTTTSGITDLGGATLNLGGGVFTVSGTVHVKTGYGNYGVCCGVLRASPSFSGDDTLLRCGEIGAPKGDSAHNVNIQSLTLEGGNYVGTTLEVFNGQYANIGPAVMVHGFNKVGIRMDGTGGGYIHHSWLGQFAPEHKRDTPTATAILLVAPQHDAYVTDVIIWSGLIGIHSHTGANQLAGIHTWNLAAAKGGTCILMQGWNGAAGKVIDSYMDFCSLVVADPGSVIISNNLFLATANIVLWANQSTESKGLVIANNRFDSEGKYGNTTVMLKGSFNSITDTFMEGNIADTHYSHKSTRATKTAAASGTSTTLDFSDALLFPVTIQEVTCSVQSATPVALSYTLPSNKKVAVHFSAAVPAGSHVTCTVEQSKRNHAGH